MPEPTLSPGPVLTTARLVLRQLTPQDALAWQRLMNEDPVMRYFPNPTPPSLERAERWVARQMAHWQEQGYGIWAVTLLEDDALAGTKLAGWCGLQLLPETGETEVAYAIARAHWGRGYASEAARAALWFGFQQAGFDRIIALVHPDNAASLRVIEKQGMTFTGLAEYFGMVLRRYVLPRDEFNGG